MNIQPMPLHERIQRLESGYAAHPEYIPAAIRAMASTPITVYLSGFDPELARLGELLGIPESVMNTMTYQEIAACINMIRTSPAWTKSISDEATALLMVPLVSHYEKRRAAREKREADTSC